MIPSGLLGTSHLAPDPKMPLLVDRLNVELTKSSGKVCVLVKHTHRSRSTQRCALCRTLERSQPASSVSHKVGPLTLGTPLRKVGLHSNKAKLGHI